MMIMIIMILIVMITGKNDNSSDKIVLVIIKNVLYDTNIIHYVWKFRQWLEKDFKMGKQQGHL